MLEGLNIGGSFSKVEFLKINLNSSQQVKEWLLSIGWQPTTWNYNKETKEKTSPKLTEDSFISLPPGIGQDYARYNVLKHRRNSILSFKDPENKGYLGLMRPDGRIEADGITCGTPTARYTHKKVVNVPAGDAIYGEEMRKCFCVKPPYRMLGADLAAIEACVMAHYTTPYDNGKIARDLLVEKGKPDWHTKNAKNIYTPYRLDNPVTRGAGKGISYMLKQVSM